MTDTDAEPTKKPKGPMSDSISDAKNDRRDLEDKIGTLIKEYEDKHGVEVEFIHMNRAYHKMEAFVNIDLDVKL